VENMVTFPREKFRRISFKDSRVRKSLSLDDATPLFKQFRDTSFRLAMECHFLVPGTILSDLKTTCCILLVFLRAVVATFALCAGKNDIDAHTLLDNFGDDTAADRVAAFTNGETKLCLHGDRVNQLDNKL